MEVTFGSGLLLSEKVTESDSSVITDESVRLSALHSIIQDDAFKAKLVEPPLLLGTRPPALLVKPVALPTESISTMTSK